MNWRHPFHWALLAVAAILWSLVFYTVPFSRDWAYVCENTGSQKGYIEWALVIPTRQWHEPSPLEEFVKTNAPDSLVHRWTSYAGTGRNIFGVVVLYGHGSPGSILMLDHALQKRWISRHSAEDVMKLYKLLVSDDQPEVDRKIREILEEERDRPPTSQ